MNTNLLEALPKQWREEADLLRRRGAIPLAECMESMAVDLESRIRAWLEEELPIHQASEESGYSEDHLRRLVRDEVLPDNRPPGSEGEIRIRRRDLPRRPNRTGAMMCVVDALAEELGR